MKIHAYQEMYVNRVQRVLGEAFDYAVNVCHIPGEQFVTMFSSSFISQYISVGDPKYILGKSGIEILTDVIREETGKEIDIIPEERFIRTIDYWIGWTVACYQWYSDRKFSEIFSLIRYEELERMYPTLHEADISKSVEIIDSIIRERQPETNLKRFRTACRKTQAQLSEKSGVSLRSIQMYEQRQKNINRASVETVYALAKAIGCSIEDLMEK